jgi:ATP-dependent RNA helicase DDX60
MASHILVTLEGAEEAWRAQSPEWKRKVSRWGAWQACQQNKKRLTQKSAARKKDPDDEIPQQSEDRSWESYFDPKDPSPQFSFAGTAAYPKEELVKDIEELRRRMSESTPEFLYSALWRGIAVHHSGMTKLYRVLVERCASLSWSTT